MDTQTSQTSSSETSTQPQNPPPPKPPFTRAPEFFELYANNVFFESSVWDMNLIFGLFDQTPNMPPSKQLGAIRIPWRQAKIMAYFLAMNVAFHENTDGPIHVPPGLAPPDIAKFVQERFPNDAKAQQMAERINRIRAELDL